MSIRPTVSEQLRGISHMLSTVVLPLLHDGYGGEMLRWSIAALERIGDEAPRLPDFFSWERAASIALIERSIPLLQTQESALSARLQEVLRTVASEGESLASLPSELESLRGAIADLIGSVAFAPGNVAVTRLLDSHITEICARQP